MRRLAFFAPLALTVSLAAAAQAQAPQVTVALGPTLQRDRDNLGQRDIAEQADRLGEAVRRALANSDYLDGAQVNLVLTDLKPNRPTIEQANQRPGLSIIDSFSIGGAAIEGEVILADGRREPVRYSRYSNDIRWSRGMGTWWDADRAFDRFAVNVAEGRLVSR
ncbi:MAG: hypothetical protein EON88_08245 [Brevundimonas sp.]|nr:MAG: hypothetical protein EON88_27095 [Brevundimonas sp.]RZJ96227.1 MAG: hypothetical protein EON88_08245 [Brevundimonas sp.]